MVNVHCTVKKTCRHPWAGFQRIGSSFSGLIMERILAGRLAHDWVSGRPDSGV
jgi:hypothetical protein